MDKELLEQTIKNLRDAADQIWSYEYDNWYRANTMKTLDMWISDYPKDQIDTLRDLADKLEEME